MEPKPIVIQLTYLDLDAAGVNLDSIQQIRQAAMKTQEFQDWDRKNREADLATHDPDIYFVMDFGYEEVEVTFR